MTPLIGTGSNSENPITPKAVIAYQPDADDLFYVSAAKGYRPGGTNGELSSMCGSESRLNRPVRRTRDLCRPTRCGAMSWARRIRSWMGECRSMPALSSSIGTIFSKPSISRAAVRISSRISAKCAASAANSRPRCVPSRRFSLDLSVAHVEAKYTRTVCAGPTPCSGVNPPAQPVVTEGDQLPGAPWTFLASAEYGFPVIENRKPYLRIDYQYSTAQTALQPIQDPNNGVSDPTYTGLPRNQESVASCRSALGGHRSVVVRAESDGFASRALSYARHEHLGPVLRSHGPAAHHRDHGDVSPLTGLPVKAGCEMRPHWPI